VSGTISPHPDRTRDKLKHYGDALRRDEVQKAQADADRLSAIAALDAEIESLQEEARWPA
jgi:hypothetical protein